MLSIFLTSLYINPQGPEELYAHYYAPYYVLVLTLCAYLLNKYITKIEIRVTVILIIGYLLIRNYSPLVLTMPNAYKTMGDVGMIIYSDYSKYYPEERQLIVYDHNPWERQFDYYTGQYYYFLEKYTDRPQIKLTNYEQNIAPIRSESTVYYLVCSWFSPRDTHVVLRDRCIKPFQDQYTSMIKSGSGQLIGQITTPGSVGFFVYRFMAIETHVEDNL